MKKKNPDKKEFWLTDNHTMDFMEKYYNLARDIYNISYDEEALIYEGINIDMVMNHNDVIKKCEIRHALYIIIKWIGWFQEK